MSAGLDKMTTNLHNVQLQNHVDGCPNFVFKSMHFETHAFKHDLCPCGHRNLFGEGCDLGRVE